MAEAIAELAGPPPIDATDIVLDADALGLGKPVEYTNAALQADVNQPGPDPSSPTTGGRGIMELLNPGQGISPELKNEFVRLQRGKMDATGQIQADNERRYNEDRKRVLDQFGAENATINDIPKWDVEAERKKYHTDPLESFGSFASIFAMVASAFTRAPMENALNGAAAAMNAKRENNEFEYQRSMDAFKLNSDLAIKRFNMQHAAMQDAFGVMEKDTQRGNAKLLETATKYGDEQVLALYNAGMFPEIQKLEDSRLKANEGVVNAIANYRRMEDQEKRTKLLEQKEGNLSTEEAKIVRERAAQLDQERVAQGLEPDPAGSKVKALEEVIKATSKGKKQDGDVGTYKGTEAQNKNLMFATMADRALANIERVKQDNNYKPSPKDLIAFELMEGARRSGGSVNLPGMMANYVLSPAAQQYYQAAREFAAGVLRKETGAAFAQNELTNTITRYIDSPGDSPELEAQKEHARAGERKMMWMSTGLPSTAWSMDGAEAVLSGKKPPPPKEKPMPINVGAATKDDREGQTYERDGWIWEKRGDKLVPVKPKAE